MNPNRTWRRTLLLLACMAPMALAAPATLAQSYPNKPLRIVVGFAPGGPTDIVARAFGEHLQRQLGQPVIVENRPGANTVLAAEAVAGAPADGYTLLMAATNHTMIPALYGARIKFDAARSFTAVCTLVDSPTVLVVGPSVKATTLAGFIQSLKAEPGKRTFGSPGLGSQGHFAGERFMRLTGTALNHIPYKGAAPAVSDLLGGQLDASFATLGSVLPQIQSGKLTALAVAAPQRSALLPGVPTFDEAGVKGLHDVAWYGLLAPAATPAAIVSALEKSALDFTQAPATADKLRPLGLQPQPTCGSAFAQQLQRDTQANTQLARQLDLKLD